MTTSRARFEALYALAFLGVHLAFMPLFVLLLPRRVAAIEPDDSVSTLSLLLLVGGIAASAGHIAAGHLSDRRLARHGSRRAVIAAGLVLLLASYAGLALARSAPALAITIVFYQLALNLMFAPLGALITDYVENARKGRVAGWMNLALPLSSSGIAVVGFLFADDGWKAFALVAIMVAITVLPLLIAWPVGPLLDAAERPRDRPATARRIADFRLAWAARLCVQFGAFGVTSYLFLYVQTAGGSATDPSRAVAVLSSAALVIALGATLLSGYASDWLYRRRVPVAIAAIACAIALGGLATFPVFAVIVGLYALFHFGLAAFIAIDTALVAQLVAGLTNRGTLLGFMNLANTLPAIVLPAMALAVAGVVAPGQMLGGMLWILAAGALLAAAAMLRIRSVD